MNPSTVNIHTFGCKVNTYDSGLLEKNLSSSGYECQASDSKIHLFNTCAVTGEATREALRQVRRVKAKDPFATVVVTGCAAQVDTDAFADFPGVDLIIANSHKARLPEILDHHFKGTLQQRVFKSNIFRKSDLEEGGGIESEHTRAFLKIQDGCNSFCSYCVIPFARGRSRSLSIDHIVSRVREFEQRGLCEVVLTGIHIGDYEDGEKKLDDLIEAVLKRTTMPRLRLTSLEPLEVTERMIELFSDERLCPHFHMSIQSAEDQTLREMKRVYQVADIERTLKKIDHIPNVFVGMDVIAGFPTETREQFEETYLNLANLPWTRLHVFPYSERPGTTAQKLGDPIEVREKKMRSQRLRDLSWDRFCQKAENQIGREQKLLILQKKTAETKGLSRNFWKVKLKEHPFAQRELTPGEEVNIRVTGFEKTKSSKISGDLVGEIL